MKPDDMDVSAIMCSVLILLMICPSIAAEEHGRSVPAPYFTAEPQSSVLRPGDNVSVYCEAGPESQLTRITWTHNGHHMDSPFQSFSSSSSSASRLDIVGFSGSNEGLYQCIASSSVGSVISRPAQLRLASLGEFEEDSHNTTETVYEGSSVIIECPQIASSYPPVTWQFLLNGSHLHLRQGHHVVLPTGKLFIASVTWSDVGVYQCVAVNPLIASQRVSASSVNLRVQVASSSHQVAAQIVGKSQRKVSVAVGETLTIECVANGWPVPEVTWSRYGGQLPRQRHHQFAGLMTVEDVQLLDDGTYVCHASNGVGEVQSAVVFVRVLMAPVMLSAASDETVTEGNSLTLNCHANAVPSVAFAWKHNAQPIYDSEFTTTTDSSITLTQMSQAQAGVYQCVANNVVGSAYATAVVTVTPSWHVTNPVSTGSSVVRQLTGVELSTVGPRVNRKQPSRRQQRRNRVRGGRTRPEDVLRSVDDPGLRPLPRADDDDEDDDDVGASISSHDGRVRSPTAPTVVVLSDSSVMVRWTPVPTPQRGGLRVMFYKVQYRRVGARRKSRGWETVDEDIPSNKHSIRVNRLRAGSRYQFRVVAVYSNNDNKHGPNSSRVRLRPAGNRQTDKSPRSAPVIVEVYSSSPSSIVVKWQYVGDGRERVDGFVILYRRYGDDDNSYLRQIERGSQSRAAVLRQLNHNTTYSIVVRSYNRHGQSELSNTVVMTTIVSSLFPGVTDYWMLPTTSSLVPPRVFSRPDINPDVPRPSYAAPDGDDDDDDDGGGGLPRQRRRRPEDETLYIVLGVIVGAILISVLVALFVCARQQYRQRLLLAAAVQVNSSAVHRVYNKSSQPLLSSSASAVTGRHCLPAHHRRASPESTAGDLSNIPSSAGTTETMVDRSRTSSNSSSESSRQHLYDRQYPPTQTVKEQSVSEDDADADEQTRLRPSFSDVIRTRAPAASAAVDMAAGRQREMPRLTSSCCDIKSSSSQSSSSCIRTSNPRQPAVAGVSSTCRPADCRQLVVGRDNTDSCVTVSPESTV